MRHHNHRRAALEAAARKVRLARADQWDGTAHVFDPIERKYVPADEYKAAMCEPMMAWFDRLRPYERARLANSVDGYGAETATIRR